MKKRLAWILAVAMVMSFAFAVPAYAAEGEFTVHAQAPAEWTTPALWAWSTLDGNSTNVFEAWPGQVLTADPDNAGWFYYSVPDTTNFIIINDNGAGSQTVDVEVESKELWITVTEAGADGKFAADVAYEAPEGFVTAAAEEAAVEEAAPAEEAAADVPKTGVIGLGIVYGLGALATGALALKKRNK
jgi:hypothetical protein